ncbi:MAG: DUF2161 family putative PD-(D/E)XK-type phosphodiesterase [Pseudomonadota bacterium]
MRETELYPPIKALLERQGYTVKGEVTGCDMVGRRGDEPPVIVELKRQFSLALVYQGIDRQSLSDDVYLAVPPFTARSRSKEALALCRRLGLGLMSVHPVPPPLVDVLLDPGSYQPRKRKARQGRLLREFERRVGDPTEGGGRGRPIMTAYRQDALRCALHLRDHGPTKAADLAAVTGVTKARAILSRDVYGWFERVERGIYQLTPKGAEGLAIYADHLPLLAETQNGA